MTYRKASFDEKFYNKSPTITSFLRASEPSCFGPPQAQAHTMPRASGAALSPPTFLSRLLQKFFNTNLKEFWILMRCRFTYERLNRLKTWQWQRGSDQKTLTVGESITVRLLSSLTRLNMTNKDYMLFLYLCSEAVEYKLVKLETSHTVILPPTVSVLCSDIQARKGPNIRQQQFSFHSKRTFSWTRLRVVIYLTLFRSFWSFLSSDLFLRSSPLHIFDGKSFLSTGMEPWNVNDKCLWSSCW